MQTNPFGTLADDLKVKSASFGYTANGDDIDTRSETINDSKYGIVTGFAIGSTQNVVAMQFYFSAPNSLQMRVRNLNSNPQDYTITVYYI